MQRYPKLIPILLMLFFFLACKHELPQPAGGATGTGGGPGGGAASACSPDTAYFNQVLPVLNSNCAVAGCHISPNPADGLDLTTYQSIISSGEVKKFQPGNSDLWKRINETDPAKRMPLGRSPLSQAQKDLVYKWILQGAQNNFCQSSVCDTANVSYTASVRPIIANKCQGCHSGTAPGGGHDLGQYAVVKARATDGKLWGAINHLPGFSPMPKVGPKLTDCEIAQFRKWIAAGAPNN